MNPQKRQGSPIKPKKDGKAMKALSLTPDDDNQTNNMYSASGSTQNGGAHAAVINNGSVDGDSSGPPQWFRDFEARQAVRFDNIKEIFEGFKMEMDNIKDEIKLLKEKIELADVKIDDLENRSRRNNIIIFNLPEGAEGSDLNGFVSKLLQDSNAGTEVSFQRAHRTGKINPNQPNPKPRPIHIGFTFFQEKETCRRALMEFFKKETFGPSNSRLFVSNDFSLKVQKLRKEKLPELRKLRSEGNNAILMYPATIKVLP